MAEHTVSSILHTINEQVLYYCSALCSWCILTRKTHCIFLFMRHIGLSTKLSWPFITEWVSEIIYWRYSLLLCCRFHTLKKSLHISLVKNLCCFPLAVNMKARRYKHLQHYEMTNLLFWYTVYYARAQETIIMTSAAKAATLFTYSSR